MKFNFISWHILFYIILLLIVLPMTINRVDLPESVRLRAKELGITLTPQLSQVLLRHDEPTQLKMLTNPVTHNIIQNVQNGIIYNLRNGYDYNGNCPCNCNREYAK